MKLKFNFKTEAVSKITEGSMFKLILRTISYAALIWLIIFVLETILASGGLYVKGAPFIVVEMIAILVSMLVYSKRINLGKKELITSIAIMVLAYAILDFLVVNLLLQNNDYSIYKFWAYYLKFAVIIVIPFIRSKSPKITTPNLELPLTKDNLTL